MWSRARRLEPPPASVAPRRRGRAAALCLLTLLLAGEARAGDPQLRYHTIESPHFRITYHDPLGRAAQRLAVVAEAAHAQLVPVLRHTPRFRTEVLLSDDTDFSNGSATALPFNTVRLYLTSPDDRSELNDYDDWLSALFIHEYTHILHLDTVNGLPKWLNYLLGLGVNTIYAPNQIQPRWFIEGLAVVEETERTSGGRLRSALFDMYLRSHVLEGKFLRLDQVTNNTRLFPRGNVAYLYGSAFLRYLAKRLGDETLTRISHRYGGCFSPDCYLPWGMSRTLRKLTGHTYGTMYEDFRRAMEQRYEAQRTAIARSPLGITAGRALTDWKAGADRPVFSPDGSSILWLDSDPYRRPALWRYDRRSGQARVELEIDGASGLALSFDGQTAVMARLHYYRANFSYNDLVLYRRDRRELVALTDGLRADNPAISPDGRQIAFEVNSTGTRRLGIMTLPEVAVAQPPRLSELDARAVAVPEVWRARAAAPVRFPLPQKEFSQVYTPAWSPDGKYLAFSYWQEGGYRDIVTLELATGRLTYVTRDRALDLEPHFSRDGRYLYFVSDRTGVYNLYAHHLASDTTWQVSSVLMGVFSPSVSPDGGLAAYVGFVAEGYRIEVMDLEPARFVLAPAAPLDRPEARRIADPDPEKLLPVRRYQPARTFFRTPLSLLSLQLPLSAPGAYGQNFGFTLATQDLVGLHALSAGFSFASNRADATGFFARYTYGRLWNSLYLDFSRSMYPRGGLRVNGRTRSYDEEAISTAAGTSLPILRDVARSATLSFNYTFTYWRNRSGISKPEPDDSSLLLPEIGRYAGLSMSFSFSDARRFLYSVGPEQGRSLFLSATIAHRVLGGEYTVYSMRVAASQYFGIPWPWRWAKNHALSLSYEGGFSSGDLKRRGLFYLGGFPTGEDYLRAALFAERPGQAKLRGYEAGATYGDQYHVLSAEYRFPILWIERGYETLPFYFWRLHAAAYSDFGGAFFGNLGLDKLKLSVGGELRLDGALGYYLPFTLELGYAHGFMEGAASGVYFLLNNPL